MKPGLPFRELLAHRKESGSFFGDVDEYCARWHQYWRQRAADFVVDSSRGRVVRIVNVPLEDGGWVTTHEDVTEHQQLLAAHEQSERIVGEQKHQLDVALDNMTHGLCMFDAEGHIVLFNRRYSEMMGQSAEYLRGLSLLDLFKNRKAAGALRGDPDKLFSGVMTSMREGKTTVREMMRVDGICLRVVDQPMESGGWVATYEDVTEQRRTERDRDRSRAFLDLIIDNVPSAIFVKNVVDRKYVLVNSAGERFWGISRQMMTGKTSKDVLPEAEAKQLEARDDLLLQSGSPVFDERELPTPHGGVRSISSRRLTIRDQSDEAQYIWASSMTLPNARWPPPRLPASRTTIRSPACPTARCFASSSKGSCRLSDGAPSLRCSISISITSKASTIRWATRWATSC